MAKTPAIESTNKTFIYNVVQVERVVDGDSIELLLDLGFNIFYKVDVRIQGVDTPERNTPEGKVVKAKVEEWLTGKKNLVLISKELDKYGRVLGEITEGQNGASLNKWLIEKKLARVYNGEKKVEWTKEQIEAIIKQATIVK